MHVMIDRRVRAFLLQGLARSETGVPGGRPLTGPIIFY